MQTPVFLPDSLRSSIRASFGTSFMVSMPEWPSHMTAAQMSPSGSSAVLIISPKGTSTPGRVVFRIGLPGEQDARELQICVMVSTDRHGIHMHRAPTPAEIHALRAAWWSIRDAALLECHLTATPDELATLIARFAKTESVFLSSSVKLGQRNTNSPDYVLMATGSVHQAARSLPVFPVATPKAADAQSATPLQKDMQAAIENAERALGEIGNGYAWAVEMVLKSLEKPLTDHTPGFNLEDYRFTSS